MKIHTTHPKINDRSPKKLLQLIPSKQQFVLKEVPENEAAEHDSWGSKAAKNVFFWFQGFLNKNPCVLKICSPLS